MARKILLTPFALLLVPLLLGGFIAGLIFVIPLRLPEVPLLPAAEPEEDGEASRRRDERA